MTTKMATSGAGFLPSTVMIFATVPSAIGSCMKSNDGFNKVKKLESEEVKK